MTTYLILELLSKCQLIEKSPVLVAGEATTSKFGLIEMSNGTKDAFLLELNKKNGSVNSIDVFGLTDGVDNGALVPGNLNLHLTQDKHAVIMGNARVENKEVSNPYLIERYEVIKETFVDERFVFKKLEYKFLITLSTVVEKEN
mmetsp:Transcript_47409/g.53824  ORF Transcript_47409/g.53824 Transcript_47409/m.53824 type:complete len:144 (+) Transcript_47409:614-1045(+)